jgi:hypothetical protein
MLDAGVRLWATVTRLTSGRSHLGLRDRADLREAALGAITALNGREAEGGGCVTQEVAQAMFVGLVAWLARNGIDNTTLAVWLDESWTDRERARSKQ